VTLIDLDPGRLYDSAPFLDFRVEESLKFTGRRAHDHVAGLFPRSIYEEARDVARALAKTEAFERSRHDRKRVEMLFAHLKRILRLGRLRLRGPRGAQFEFTLAAIAQNLRRLAKGDLRAWCRASLSRGDCRVAS
jgi:hypothetical protein